MDVEGIILREIEKDKYHMIAHGIWKNKKTKKKQRNEHLDTEKRLVVTRWMGEMDEEGQKVQNSNYKINKSWRCNVPHGNYV